MQKKTYHKEITVALVLAMGLELGYRAPEVEAATPSDLTQLSIEDLMNVAVVSPTKQAQRLADTASAVFVITQEDIRRSGVTSVPEALRLAPGVQVARIDASKWAITIRGFNGRFANKLLVLVDGRSIYTPTFSGVYWEIQDFLLEDIERIEVIRGPGASLWGSNAVNGVINILTRSAADTGNLVSLTAGNEEQALIGLRHSGQLGDAAYYRIYGKYLNRDGLVDLEERNAEDDWHLSSGGFRLDWTPTGQDSFTLQGGLYDAALGQNFSTPSFDPPYVGLQRDTADHSGGHLHGRWQRILSDTSSVSLQMYYQNDQREDALIGAEVDTVDLDLQHTFAWGKRHAVIWGLGYRRYHDEYQQTALTSMNPSSLNYDLFSAFAQDQISLVPEKLELTLGTRLDHNDFTGWEIQPNARLLWKLHPQHRMWAAVSRAVRTPSRADTDVTFNLATTPPQPPINLPTLFTFEGDPDFESETVVAYELGYRTWPSERLSLDFSTFYNDYDELRAMDIRSDLLSFAGNYLQIPTVFVNAVEGQTYGFEMAANWQATDWWRLQLAYSYLRVNFQNKPGFVELNRVVREGAQPQQQVSLFSTFNVRDDLDFDVQLYYVDEMPDLVVSTVPGTVAVDDYFSINARLSWRPYRDVELSLVGANLLGPSRTEFVQETYSFPEQVERSIYGQFKWSF